jgi:integrase
VARLGRREWDEFIRSRREGRLPGLGPVRNRQIQYDLKALRAALTWAIRTRGERGEYLLDRDPTAGLKMPKEASPRRVSISQEECDALFGVAEGVGWRFRVAFVLAFYTGCRIGSIRQLRWSDIDLKKGRIRWRGETDKSGYERDCTLRTAAVEVLKALQRQRRVIGDGWVFPSPTDPSQPASRNLFRDYWKRAVKLAGLLKVERRGWHSLRRRFATASKGQPDRDTMHLMGLKGTAMLNTYRQTEEEAQRKVVEAVGTLAATG